MERMRKYITIPNSPIPQRADASGAVIGRASLAAGVARPGSVRENADGADSAGLSEMDRRQREIYNKQQQLLRDQRTADQEKLLVSISGVHPPASPHCRIICDNSLDSYVPKFLGHHYAPSPPLLLCSMFVDQ